MFTIPPTGASQEGGYEPVFVVSRPKLSDGDSFTYDIVVR